MKARLTKQDYCAVSKTNTFHTLSQGLAVVIVIVIIPTFIKHLIAAKVSPIHHVSRQLLNQQYAVLNTLSIIFVKFAQDSVQILNLVQQEMH